MTVLEDMRIFVATVESGSFTSCAEKLGLSKQFVSRRVSDLEDRLGARLMLRTTRRLSVTDLGQAYLERCLKIIEDVDDAEAFVGRGLEKPRGRIKISAPVSFGSLHLAPALADFLAEMHDIQLDVVLNDRMVDIVGEGFDVGLRIGQLEDSTLLARRLADVCMLLVASPKYLASAAPLNSPDDLSRHSCLLYGHSPGVDWGFRSNGKIGKVAVKGRLLANNGDITMSSALKDQGIARLPDFMVCKHIESGALVEVLPAFRLAGGGLYAVYAQHRQRSLAVQALIQYLAKAFSNPSWRIR